MSLPIITIARSFGSGGRLIGQKVSILLGVPLYDKELVQLTAERNGFHAAVVEQMQRRKPTSLLYALSTASTQLSLQDRVFYAQAEVIRDLAEKGPAVFVGRCADCVLQDRHRLLRVFVHAPLDQRAKRAVQEYSLQVKDPKDYVRKSDKKRKAYYDYFTHQNWGQADHYDLCLNSAIGLDLAADLIARAAKEMAD